MSVVFIGGGSCARQAKNCIQKTRLINTIVNAAKKAQMSKSNLFSHLDDDQTELTLQQEEEALPNAVGCVPCLEHINKHELM